MIKFNDFRIANKVISVFVVLLMFFFIYKVITLNRLRLFSDEYESVMRLDNTFRSDISEVGHLIMDFDSIVDLVNNSVNEHNSSDLIKANEQLHLKVNELIGSNPESKSSVAFTKLTTVFARFTDLSHQAIQITSSHQMLDNQRYFNLKEVTRELMHSLYILHDEQSSLHYGVQLKKIEQYRKNEYASGIWFLLMLVVIIYIAYILTRNLIRRIEKLKLNVEKVAKGNFDVDYSDYKHDEVGELNADFGLMTKSLKNTIGELEKQNWIKDGVAKLSKETSGDKSVREICDVAISFICRYLDAGTGVIYHFNEEENHLKMVSSYAFTERDILSSIVVPGEGIVGQVALERKPILMKNVLRSQRLINSGIVSEPPLFIYTLPLVYVNNLVGVLEIASLQSFSALQSDFLSESVFSLASSVFIAHQSDKIKRLLADSKQHAAEVQKINEALEEQKQVLEVQSRNLQESNAQLEIQQQMLQQQSEELQQSNAQLEEQQQQLQQQSEELQQSNAQLEIQKSRVEKQMAEVTIMNNELKEARKALDEKANMLETANKYKGEFMANMSHELRTPLNSVILLSQLLGKNKAGNMTPEDVAKLSVINNAGNELLRLINDLLDLSKIEAGRVELEVRQFMVDEILEEQRAYFSSVALDKNLVFTIENLLTEPNRMIVSDSLRISQILRNFLSNAFKFTSKGGVTLSVSDANMKPYAIKLMVTDTGIGIPEDKLDLIFEAFKQVDGGVSRMYGGTGLGLSISLQLSAILKGKIAVESHQGEGSRFILYLPDVLNSTDEPLVHAPKGQQPVQPEIKADHRKDTNMIFNDDRNHLLVNDDVVLIIEDDTNFATIVVDVVRDAGKKAIVAVTGNEGLKMAEKYNPKGIILDIGLPDIDGIEVLHILKTTATLRNIPVHVVTGRDNASIEAIKEGAIGYVQKPVNEVQLNTVIESLMATPDNSKKTVLIVEDNANELIAITEVIKEIGVQILVANSLTSAMEVVSGATVDVIILDLGLTDGNGLDLCKQLKNNKANIPVIIYTGYSVSEPEEAEIKQYASAIVIKTVNSGERLVDEVEILLKNPKPKQQSTTGYAKSTISMHTNIDFSGKTILVVDDDIKNTFVITSALEQYNANILSAKNGKQAIEILEQNDAIHLVLMDIMMPVMNGYEAMEAIRANDKWKNLPVIAVTAKALKEDKIKCFQSGASDYLTKPIDYDVLINVVNNWFQKSL